MSIEGQNIFGESKPAISIKEHLSAYLASWPLFLVCTFVCVGAGIFYSKYTVSKYLATTSLLVNGTTGGSNSGDLIETALSGKRDINLNNEIMLLNAAGLMERTVAKNGFNINYFKKDGLHNIDIYNETPFLLVAHKIIDSNASYAIHIKNISPVGGQFLYGPEKNETLYNFSWDMPFSINGAHFLLQTKKKINSSDHHEYITSWQPIKTVANELSKGLSINAIDTKTSIIQLLLKTGNLQKGKDILNALFTEFYSTDIEERSNLSASTVQFIDDRLLLISGELKGVEGTLEDYKGNNQLVDIKGQSNQSLENSNLTSKTIKDLSIQQSVVTMILNYFANPVNNTKLVPSSLGINDGTLSSLITQYNELQLKREREAPLVTPNSTVMQDLNTQLNNLKSSILESLNNISKNLKLQESSFQQQNSQYKNFLSTIPHNERVLQEIKRKQGITEGLYLYLLQKREEAAISSTASRVPHYKQIDTATGFGPVEPNAKNIILYTTILGLFLAFAIIYIKDFLNEKIGSKRDIANKISVPLIGEINHIPRKKLQPISVMDRSLTSEQFRALRTNLSFLLKDSQHKTVLITSSVSGEGKSFISLNLAAVFAIPGKKVALLEFDTRNPVIADRLGIDNKQGITDMLKGDTTDISTIYRSIEEIPSLHIYPCGSLPINPADLLQSENLPRLFESLKANYDYIIIDTPPAALVSDAFILGKYANIILYIIRQNKTLKKNLDFIKETAASDALGNIKLILNDIKKIDTSYGEYYI